jgi:hypothetical protein
METPAPENWYAPTAYDSRKKKDLPPPDPAAWQGEARALRSHPLPIGVFCGEYRTEINGKLVEELKQGIVGLSPNHEIVEMASMSNPKTLFATLQWLAGAATIICIVALCIVGVTLPPNNPEDLRLYLYTLAPFILFIIFSICRKLAPNKNNIVFNRRTGMVTIPRSRKAIPFAELDGYYYCPQSPVGYKYNLYFGHRYSPAGFSSPWEWAEKYWMYREWEYYQQFMDISMPLPESPYLEPYRHLDPTTAAYDKKHNRPPRYWRDMSMDKIMEERDKGFEITKNFRWDRIPAADHIPQECMDRLLPGARLFK